MWKSNVYRYQYQIQKIKLYDDGSNQFNEVLGKENLNMNF